jgi:hypothetical protein
MATRDELVVALAGRYASSNRKERGRILDEFAAVSGLHRKHAMRLLRSGRPGRRSGPRPARRLYNDAVREALIVLWEASDRVQAGASVPEPAGSIQLNSSQRCPALSCGLSFYEFRFRLVGSHTTPRSLSHIDRENTEVVRSHT